MIRVLQLGMTDNWGGIESYLINYYRNIDKKKVNFDFINIYNNDLCFQDELLASNSKVYSVHSYYKHPFKYIHEVKKIINENNYEIIHCNMNSAAMLYPLIASKLSKAKVVIAHSHNSSSDKGILKAVLHNINRHFIPLLANTFFSCSEVAGEWFYSKKIRKSKKYYVINNAVDINTFRYDQKTREKKRKELKINDNTIVLGHVGRFNKQKNHECLIDIFYEYHKKNSDSILLLTGIGPLMDKIKEKVNSLGLNECVRFFGQRKDVNEIYQAMDVFLLPSLYEGLPLVGVEAQCSGVTCLFADTITKELNIIPSSFLISLNDIDKWCELIKINPNRKNDYKYIKKNYSIENNAKKLIKIYEERKKV